MPGLQGRSQMSHCWHGVVTITLQRGFSRWPELLLPQQEPNQGPVVTQLPGGTAATWFGDNSTPRFDPAPFPHPKPSMHREIVGDVELGQGWGLGLEFGVGRGLTSLKLCRMLRAAAAAAAETWLISKAAGRGKAEGGRGTWPFFWRDQRLGFGITQRIIQALLPEGQQPGIPRGGLGSNTLFCLLSPSLTSFPAPAPPPRVP